MFLFLRSLILDAADWCAHCYRRLTQHGRAEAIAKHPASLTSRTPAPLEPRPFTEADVDAMRDTWARDILRCWVANGCPKHQDPPDVVIARFCDWLDGLPTYTKEHQ